MLSTAKDRVCTLIQIHHTSLKVYLYSGVFIVLKPCSLDRIIAYGSL